VTLRMEFSETETGWSTPAVLEVLEDSFLNYEVRLPINPTTQPFMMARLVAELSGP
jgi:hypothetical protein